MSFIKYTEYSMNRNSLNTTERIHSESDYGDNDQSTTSIVDTKLYPMSSAKKKIDARPLAPCIVYCVIASVALNEYSQQNND